MSNSRRIKRASHRAQARADKLAGESVRNVARRFGIDPNDQRAYFTWLGLLRNGHDPGGAARIMRQWDHELENPEPPSRRQRIMAWLRG